MRKAIFSEGAAMGSGILGMGLLLPASYFMLTLIVRICFGGNDPYYFIAPSFLQSPFHLFAFHKAQVIVGSLVLAAVVNSMRRGERRHWLNTAIVIQATLLFVVLLCYMTVEHLRH
jgi:uncharacterized membrane protein AbrB (regulator of aidB expression)